jgi:iron-sulfur cluster assembly accessory protein
LRRKTTGIDAARLQGTTAWAAVNLHLTAEKPSSLIRARVERRHPLLTWVPKSRIFRSMMDITESAVRQLQSLLSQRAENAQKGLRVQVARGGCSGMHYEMTLDERKQGDAVVERDGMQFFIDGDSVPYLRGATLDFSGGLSGAGFRVVNPNASRTCGCGTSFEAAKSA